MSLSGLAVAARVAAAVAVSAAAGLLLAWATASHPADHAGVAEPLGALTMAGVGRRRGGSPGAVLVLAGMLAVHLAHTLLLGLHSPRLEGPAGLAASAAVLWLAVRDAWGPGGGSAGS
ncbi:MAG: hypothetical protein LRS49_03890 [Desulfurococcales archaeon]|nr:hypothetical protein [Desulfurococcales archaeon]